MFYRLFRISWTPNRLCWWEKTRIQGKRHFVLWRGVIFWGGFMFVFMQLWQYVFWYYRYHSAPPAMGAYLLISAIVYPIGGWWWGNIIWAMTERSYQAHRQHDTSALPSRNDTTEVG